MLTWQIWFTVGLVVCLFIGLLKNKPPDVLFVGAIVLLGVAGVLTPAEMFSGFSNSAPMTVAALYIVAAALRETGSLAYVSFVLLGKSHTEVSALTRMGIWVTTASAFLNNTPLVAMLMPVIGGWCRNNRVSPSRLLMPLSFFAILGGTCTLIGTSTNLVVQGLLQQSESSPDGPLRPMTLFELAPVGVPYAILGVLFLCTIGKKLLPARKDFFEQTRDQSREYIINMKIEKGCRLAGKTVVGAGLRHLSGLFLIEIHREDTVFSPVGPDYLLFEDDVLTFTGVVETIIELQRIPNLSPVLDKTFDKRTEDQRDMMLYEAVISRTSPLVGKSIRGSNFRAHYNAVVVAVHRGGERLQSRLGDIVLRPGDTLLLQSGPNFAAAHRNDAEFYLVSGVEDSRPARHDRATLSLILLALLIFLMTSGILSIVLSAFLVAGLMVLTKCISPSEARQSVDLQTLLTICSSFGLSHALVKTGIVHGFTESMTGCFGQGGPYLFLGGVFFVTMVLTSLVTNSAAVAVMFPFAVQFASELGVSPRPFIIMITLAASACFMTPVGYQTNLMVYGPGGYRFTDYFRVGAPLCFILMAVAMLMVPWLWPF